MRPKVILYEHPWFFISLFFGLGIKHTLKPLQADIGVGESRFGARIQPSRGGIRGPVISIDCSRPDYYRVQTPTVGGNIFDGSHHRPLNASTSIASRIVLTDKDFNRVKHTQHDPHLVHVINILRQNGRVLYFFFNYLKPVPDFIIHVVPVPVLRPVFSCYKLWTASLECLSPVHAWRLKWSDCRGALAGGTERY